MDTLTTPVGTLDELIEEIHAGGLNEVMVAVVHEIDRAVLDTGYVAVNVASSNGLRKLDVAIVLPNNGESVLDIEYRVVKLAYFGWASMRSDGTIVMQTPCEAREIPYMMENVKPPVRPKLPAGSAICIDGNWYTPSGASQFPINIDYDLFNHAKVYTLSRN